jgi:triosephosphate isomerase
MKKPILLINTKAYWEVSGKRAKKLAQDCRRLSRDSDAEIIIAAQPSDIPLTSPLITTFAQHIDAIAPGKHTGHVLPEAVRDAGARGTLINHYERRLPMDVIKKTIIRAREAGLVSICCVSKTSLVREIAPLNPDYIAFEAPELIGTGVSVSKVEPGIVRKFVRLVKKTNPRVRVLCGAGVSTGEDVARAMELGTEGVLLASAVPKSKHPSRTISDLVKGFG